MDKAERKKYDSAEKNGRLPKLRLRTMSYCAPIWWEINGNEILGNGSMCVIETPHTVFGVTANHVLEAYEGHKAHYADAFCQLGSAPFDPVHNVIDRSGKEGWDLATFRIPEFTLDSWGDHLRVYKTETWSPTTGNQNDRIIFGGYPVNRCAQAEGERPSTMSIDFVSFIGSVDCCSENHMAFCLDSATWYWPQGERLPAKPDLSGSSGGPCFLIHDEDRIELVGFMYEYEPRFEIMRARQANLIDATGIIAPKE